MTDIIPYFAGLVTIIFGIGFYLALQEKDEQATFFNDKAIAGSLTMTSVLIN